MQIIYDLWQIAKKDLLEFSRDRLRLVTFFVMPIFMMIMTGFIFPNQNRLKNIPIGIANQDNQEISKKLVETISNLKLAGDTPAFKIKYYDNREAIKEGIKKQEIVGGLSIPKNFSLKLAKNKSEKIIIIEDQSNPQISQMLNQIFEKIIGNFSQQIGVKKINQILISQIVSPNFNKNISKTNSKKLKITASSFVMPIKTKFEGIVKGNPNYFEFVAPGIITMIVVTAVLTGLAASISREKEQGTLDGILISPINRLAIILGKALAQSIRGLIQGGIVLILAFLLFGVTIYGNIFLVILLLILGIFSFIGLGILVSAIAAEQETATQLLVMLQFPMLFLSGVFFPILMMPNIMQKIAYLTPLTYAVNAIRKVMVLGAGIGAVQNEIIILLIFGAITLSISVPVFKRVITK